MQQVQVIETLTQSLAMTETVTEDALIKVSAWWWNMNQIKTTLRMHSKSTTGIKAAPVGEGTRACEKECSECPSCHLLS